jgi:hypothetical protein
MHRRMHMADALLGAAALAFTGELRAPYSQELGKLAPEALKPAAKSHAA